MNFNYSESLIMFRMHRIFRDKSAEKRFNLSANNGCSADFLRQLTPICHIPYKAGDAPSGA